ncbi:hypothetical protein BsWGS_00416 [Bradybaena similaris]
MLVIYRQQFFTHKYLTSFSLDLFPRRIKLHTSHFGILIFAGKPAADDRRFWKLEWTDVCEVLAAFGQKVEDVPLSKFVHRPLLSMLFCYLCNGNTFI